jgi:hypothetical protein
MLADNSFSYRLLVGHIHGKRRRVRIGCRHVEHRGDARPKVFPTKIVSVGHVENLVLSRLGLTGPRGRLGENFCRRWLLSFQLSS